MAVIGQNRSHGLHKEYKVKIRELLTDESKWTQFTAARDINGAPVFLDNENAVCWCLIGAVSWCYRSDPKQLNMVMNKLWDELGNGEVVKWNDNFNRTFEEVKALVVKLDI